MTENIDKKAVGLRIKSIRQEKGMTLEEFGKLFGAGKGLVSRWENGLSIPNAERLKSIAKIGDITVNQLLNGEYAQSRYNWEYVHNFLSKIRDTIDEQAFLNTKKAIDSAFFVRLDLNDIIHLYNYNVNKSNHNQAKDLNGVKEFYEFQANILEEYISTLEHTNQNMDMIMDLEIEANFNRRYIDKIERYQKTGVWSEDYSEELQKFKESRS